MKRTVINNVDIKLTISTITLNVNSLNTWIKDRDYQGVWKKPNLTTYYLQETHFKYKVPEMFKVKRWRKMHHTNTNKN